MRRDRQMFPPRQLLHAATRGEAASDLPRRERRGEEGTKNPSFLPFFPLAPLRREFTEIGRAAEGGGGEARARLFVEAPPKGSPRTSYEGVDHPYLDP